MLNTGSLRPAAAAALLALVCACAVKPVPLKEGDNALKSAIAPFRKVTLDNGLDVIVKEIHTAPIVAVYFWCNTGSMNEEERIQGISHFYEHMFFKGTKKRGVGEIDRAIKRLGGYNNAFTSKEYTAYYVVLPSENFSLAADVLADAIKNSSFPAEEIDRERGVINEEINRKDDDPSGMLYEEMFSLMFAGTPYAHSVLGTKETLAGLTRDDFKSYLGRYYVPNNMSAVIVGDVDTDKAIAEIKKLTAHWKSDPDVDKHIARFTVQRQKGIKGFELEKDVQMTYVMMAFQTSGYGDLKENAALDVVSSVLGEGKSSRLYRRLVEKEQIASSAQAFIYPLKNAGMFVVFGTMDEEKVPAFRKAVIEEVARLGTEPIADDELKKVKTMLKADFEFANETGSNIGYTLGHYNTLDILENATGYEHTIDCVTSADVMRFASKTLDPASYTVGIVKQRGSGGGEEAGDE